MFYDLCLPHEADEVVQLRQRVAALLSLGYDGAAASRTVSEQVTAADR